MVCDDELGDRLTRVRAARGMSQAELADAVGIAPAQLYRYEAGRTVPRPPTLFKIASVLKASPDWLARGEGQSPLEVVQMDIFDENESQDPQQVILRLPAKLMRSVIDASNENQRSPNDEIISRLETSFARSSAGSSISALIASKLDAVVKAVVQEAAASPEFQEAIGKDFDIEHRRDGTLAIVPSNTNIRQGDFPGLDGNAASRPRQARVTRKVTK